MTCPADGDPGMLVRQFQRDIDLRRLRDDVTAVAGGPRSLRHAPGGMRNAEDYVRGALDAAGWRVDQQPFDVRWRIGATDRRSHRMLPLKLRLHRRITGTNLIADLPGAATDRPAVVVGAHLDTVEGSPGADDNASGVAVVLETARLLASLSSRPAVTLALFDMEETGLVGSSVAARRLSSARPLTGMLCLESVGFFSDEPHGQRMPPGFSRAFPDAARAVRGAAARGDFVLVVHRRSSAAAAKTWQRAAAAHVSPLRTIALRDPRADGSAGVLLGLLAPPLMHLGRSDHASFWNRRVPAMMLTDTANFRNVRYHQPDDTPDTLDFERLAAVTAATAATALLWGGG